MAGRAILLLREEWAKTRGRRSRASHYFPRPRLDDFADLNPLRNLIKIDVEGSESAVMKGTEELFDRCRPSVICAVYDTAHALFVSCWLERKGYSVEYIGNRNEYPAHLVAAAQ